MKDGREQSEDEEEHRRVKDERERSEDEEEHRKGEGWKRTEGVEREE